MLSPPAGPGSEGAGGRQHGRTHRQTDTHRAVIAGDTAGQTCTRRDRGRGAVPSPVSLPGDKQDPCGGSGPTSYALGHGHVGSHRLEDSRGAPSAPQKHGPVRCCPEGLPAASTELVAPRWGHPAPRRGATLGALPSQRVLQGGCQRAGGARSSSWSWQHVEEGGRRRQAGKRGRGGDALLPGGNGRRLGTGGPRASGLSNGLLWSQGRLSRAQGVRDEMLSHLKARKAFAQDSPVRSWDRRSPP